MPGPSSPVRDAILTIPAEAKARQPLLTPEEDALTSRQSRLNALGGPIPSRRPARLLETVAPRTLINRTRVQPQHWRPVQPHDLSGGALANINSDDLRRLLAARSLIEGLAATTLTVAGGLPLEFGGALLGSRVGPAIAAADGLQSVADVQKIMREEADAGLRWPRWSRTSPNNVAVSTGTPAPGWRWFNKQVTDGSLGRLR